MTIQSVTNAKNVDLNKTGSRQKSAAAVLFQMTLLTTVFFLWGFVTSLNDVLIPHFKSLFTLSYTQSSLVQFCFFTAYLVMSLPAGAFMSRFGYKATLLFGLLVSAVGAVLFLPAAMALSYPIFLLGLFTLAAGITFLQVSANTFVSIIGDEKTAASRLNLTQAFNSLGTTIGPMLGGAFILAAAGAEVTREMQANQLKMPYLVICGILIALMILTGLFLEQPPKEKQPTEADKSVSVLEALRHPQVMWGVIKLFLYVGAEVSIGSFMIGFLSQSNVMGLSAADAAHYVSYYWAGAMIGRFVGSVVLRKFSPLKVLGTVSIVAVLLILAAVSLEGSIAAWALIAVGLFNSIQFPTIFSTSIENLGRLTEKASGLLIMAIFGGAVLPVLFGLIADNAGLRFAFVLPMVCYAIIGGQSLMAARHRATVRA